MKAIQKDKQIAAYAMISAPIDETNSRTSYAEYSTMRSA